MKSFITVRLGSSFPSPHIGVKHTRLGSCTFADAWCFLSVQLLLEPFLGNVKLGPIARHPFTKSWMGFAIKSPLSLAATYHAGATSLDQSSGRPLQPATLASQHHLLKSINEGIRSTTLFPDDLLVAVIVVAFLAVSSPSYLANVC